MAKMLNVRSRIASFEAHNEEIRRTSPRASSTVSHRSNSPTPSSVVSASSSNLHHQHHNASVFSMASDAFSSALSSPEGPSSSTTRIASQNRISRLQREAAAGHGVRGSHSESPVRSLRSRRLSGRPVHENDSQTGHSTNMNRNGSKNSHSRQMSGPTTSLFSHPKNTKLQNMNGQHLQMGHDHDVALESTPLSPPSSRGRAQTSPRIRTSLHDGYKTTNAASQDFVRSRNARPQSSALAGFSSTHDEIMNPELDESSDPDLPLIPRTHATNVIHDSRTNNSRSTSGHSHHPAAQSAATQAGTNGAVASSFGRQGRMAKIQKIQRIKSLEHVRRHNSKPYPPQQNPNQHNIPLDDYQNRRTTPSSDLSPFEPNDDEVTLTSVRQIVGQPPKETPAESSSGGWRGAAGGVAMSTSATARKWTQQGRGDDTERGEEKSDKLNVTNRTVATHHRLGVSRSSSSDHDEDHNGSRDQRHRRRTIGRHQRGSDDDHQEDVQDVIVTSDPTMSALSASQITVPDVGPNYLEPGMSSHRAHASTARGTPPKDDDDTYDYGGDDGSQVSVSYDQRRQKQQRNEERKAREAAAAAALSEMEGPFVQREDVEHYSKALDTPFVKTAVGVIGAATLGCIALGPVGLLLGAAAVGIGVGVMQIPEEQRANMKEKASEAMKNAQESALSASDVISQSCATTYRDSGIDDRLPTELKTCCTPMEDPAPDGSEELDPDDIRADRGPKEATSFSETGTRRSHEQIAASSTRKGHVRGKKTSVACLREGRIVSVSQIHALEPSAQPRAWLDVLASAETSQDEKIEAMEEILILAKDKQRARVFVEEGILDSIMWILGRYFEKARATAGSENWAYPNVTREESTAAKLAATCCLTLGKAYCAAIHTEGDLLLMSLYERGTVPEERQLAQMLHEVPHHARITITNDPTVVVPSKEVFTLKQMSLPQAEELARSIYVLATGTV